MRHCGNLQEFEEDFHRGDADRISLVYTEDAECLVPQTSIVKGRQAIAQAWRSIVGSGGNNLRSTKKRRLGIEVSRFEASAPDGTFLNSGKYIVIWKKFHSCAAEFRFVGNTDISTRLHETVDSSRVSGVRWISPVTPYLTELTATTLFPAACCVPL